MFHALTSENKQRNDAIRTGLRPEPGCETSRFVAAGAGHVWTGAAGSGASPESATGSQHQVMRLHSTYGNQAVLRMLFHSAPTIQPKLTVSQPGDPFEQEADCVADQVMRMTVAPGVQRKCNSGAEEEKLQPTCAECEEEEKKMEAHKKETGAGPQFAPPLVHDVLKSPGQSLDPATRAFMEPRFGHDFSHVRLHTDQRAATAAASLGARALTFGKNIAFAEGRFAPGTDAGRRLLAHELVHVVQQGVSGSPQISRSPADDAVDIKNKIEGAKDAAERKPLFKMADGLLDKYVKDLVQAAAANAQGQAAVDARDSLKLLLKAYMNSGLDLAELKVAVPKAMSVALASKDSELQNSFVAQLQGFGSGVEGQQKRLAALAAVAGQQVSAPGGDSAAWLDQNTEAIGKTLAKIDQSGLTGTQREMVKEPQSQGALGIALLSDLLRDYFTLAPTDVIPEPTGKVGKLQTDPSSKQILADCDVWATYGARVLRAMGWDTVGYLVIHPNEPKPNDPNSTREGHAVALAKKAGGSGGASYVGVSDWRVRDLGSFANDDLAIPGLLQLALNIYDPTLQKYDSYYLPAQKGGAYDTKLLDPKKNGLTAYQSRP